MEHSPIHLGSKLPKVQASIFSTMSKIANEYGALNLSQGFPDFSVSEVLIDLVHKHMKSGNNQYAPMPGVLFLREQLVENPKVISNFVKKISGVIIGFISVPLGIGGGSLMVPFMRTFGYDIRKSIGTAAAVGFLIALSGTNTMITGGKIINNVSSPFSFGYINLLGFIVFVPVTMIMARLGAKAVYKIDKKLLSKIFGTFLIIVSFRSFIEYLNIS